MLSVFILRGQCALMKPMNLQYGGKCTSGRPLINVGPYSGAHLAVYLHALDDKYVPLQSVHDYR